jgi:hypothetical protein
MAKKNPVKIIHFSIFFHFQKRKQIRQFAKFCHEKKTLAVCVCVCSAYRLGIHADWFYLQDYSQTRILAVFGGQFLCCSQIGDDPQEDLARFGNKLNKKIKF